MPLNGTDWYDDDATVFLRPPEARRASNDRSEPFAPSASSLPPEATVSLARRRPAPAIGNSDDAERNWQTLPGVEVALAWQPPPARRSGRRPWKPGAALADLLPRPPDAPIVPPDTPPIALLRRGRGIAGTAAGEPPLAISAPYAIDGPLEPARAARQRRSPWDEQPTAPPTNDQPTLIGWRDETAAPRWRTAPRRRPDTDEAPAIPAWQDYSSQWTAAADGGFSLPRRRRWIQTQADSEPPRDFGPSLWCAALQTSEGAQPRSRVRRVASWEDVSRGAGPALWIAALQTDTTEPRRLRRVALPGQRDEASWWATEAALALTWGPWLETGPAARKGRWTPAAESVPLVLDAAHVAFWVPSEQEAALRFRARVWRQRPESASPPWIGAGLITVAGPYYCVAGGLYVAGAVDGSVETVT